MSFQHSAALQAAIFSALSGNTALVSWVGSNIFDAVPDGEIAQTYVLIGEEKSVDRSDFTGGATRHDITVSVVSSAAGFSDAKVIAAEVCNALEEETLSLATGDLRQIQFRSARSRRDTGGAERRIDVIFRALIDEE